MIFSCYCCLICNYEFYYISVATETMVIKKGKTDYTPPPPWKLLAASTGACPPSLRTTDLSDQSVNEGYRLQGVLLRFSVRVISI